MDNGAGSYRRFLDGDDAGIAEIVKDYKDGLILYLNGYVKNIYIAEELAEDTFFRLITKKPNFSGKSTFKSWLYSIGRNHSGRLCTAQLQAAQYAGRRYGRLFKRRAGS